MEVGRVTQLKNDAIDVITEKKEAVKVDVRRKLLQAMAQLIDVFPNEARAILARRGIDKRRDDSG